MSSIHVRRIGSIKKELLEKSWEAALAAVQIFNNPSITFKSEIYIVLMHIAWTYLLHAYYREKDIDYRYLETANKRQKFKRTTYGAYKRWELGHCINSEKCPLDEDTKNNLRFIIELRHEIEHQMTTRIDDRVSAKFQATCLNYNHYMKSLFGEQYAIDKHLSFSLQFCSIGEEQIESLKDHKNLPGNISKFIMRFDETLSEQEYNSHRFAYRMIFVPKIVNRKGQSDQVIEFVRADSELAKQVNIQYTAIKETEKPKSTPGQIVARMKEEGYKKFNMHHHTQLWKEMDAKNPSKGYGASVAAGHWYWYECWIDEVKKHCEMNKEKYQ
ncbi:DUF3644 domain-containing protein [bacterium]|nr:MAG: DUF3644 domain-containing protein [bacterium]